MKIPRFLPRFTGIPVTVRWLVVAISFNFAAAITLFPFILYKNKYIRMNHRINNHETIHIQQQMEVGLVAIIVYLFVGFITGFWFWLLPVLFLYYILYGLFYLYGRIIQRLNHETAYVMNPFEREASHYENVLNYIVFRRPFAWWNWFFRLSSG